MTDFAPEVEAHIRAYCGWHIAPVVTETFTVVAPYGCALILPTLKLNAVTSIMEDGAEVALSSVVVREAGIIWRAAGWFRTPVVVVAEHGYDDFPLELADAMTRFGSTPRVPAGASVRVGNISVSGSSGSGLDTFSDAALDRYRIRNAP